MARGDEDGGRLVVLAPAVTTADVVREARAAVKMRDAIARGVTMRDDETTEARAARELEIHRQRMTDNLVRQNVHLCMSAWVDALVKGGERGEFNEEAHEHYYQGQDPDWDDVEQACRAAGVYVVHFEDDEAGTFTDSDGDPFDLVNDGHVEAERAEELRQEARDQLTAGWYLLEDGDLHDADQADDASDAIRAAAERADVDPQEYISEIYEWWAVDSWFGRKLAERGEHIVEGEHGGSMWGRTCTGQAISMDGVVRQIAADLWPEEWATGKERE